MISAAGPSCREATNVDTATAGPVFNGDAVAQRETVRALDSSVREAMQTAWNEICADTDHCPNDFTIRRGKIFFEPGHWADLVARLLARYGWRKG